MPTRCRVRLACAARQTWRSIGDQTTGSCPSDVDGPHSTRSFAHRLWISWMRRAAVQPAAERAAASHPRQRSRWRGDRCVRPIRYRRGERAPTGWRGRARALERADVRGCRPPLSGNAGPRPHQLACGVARAVRGACSDCTAPQPCPCLDPGVIGSRSGTLPLGTVERFTEFVGHPPMQDLSNWRMQLAANHLLAGTDSVAEIAERVGYESDAGVQPRVQEGGRQGAERVAENKGCYRRRPAGSTSRVFFSAAALATLPAFH